MNAQRKQSHLHAIHEAARFQLANTELDLAVTFCQVAAVTSSQVNSDRNIGNAREAYSAATQFLDGSLTAAQDLLVRGKLSLVESLLEALYARA